MELLYFSHFHNVSLVQWINCLLPPQGAAVHALGVQLTLWNWDYRLALSCYTSRADSFFAASTNVVSATPEETTYEDQPLN